jgi:hypothetical protein
MELAIARLRLAHLLVTAVELILPAAQHDVQEQRRDHDEDRAFSHFQEGCQIRRAAQVHPHQNRGQNDPRLSETGINTANAQSAPVLHGEPFAG